MNVLLILQYAGILAAVLSVGSVLRQRDTISTLKESNSAFKERIEQLETETQQCLASHDINDKKITQLESRLSTYDDLALVPKEFIQKHDQTQTRIVEILERIEGNQPPKNQRMSIVNNVVEGAKK